MTLLAKHTFTESDSGGQWLLAGECEGGPRGLGPGGRLPPLLGPALVCFAYLLCREHEHSSTRGPAAIDLARAQLDEAVQTLICSSKPLQLIGEGVGIVLLPLLPPPAPFSLQPDQISRSRAVNDLPRRVGFFGCSNPMIFNDKTSFLITDTP